jgi:hypothetical protein
VVPSLPVSERVRRSICSALASFYVLAPGELRQDGVVQRLPALVLLEVQQAGVKCSDLLLVHVGDLWAAFEAKKPIAISEQSLRTPRVELRDWNGFDVSPGHCEHTRSGEDAKT